MSEPVTQAEVDHVLSSIRQLVGETRRPEKALERQEKMERFVLTPQLRVAPHDVLHLMPEDAIGSVDGQSSSALTEAGDGRQSSELDEMPFVLADPIGETMAHTSDTKIGSTTVSGLSAKIEALETAIAKTSDQWEPDGNSRDAYAGTQAPAIAWEQNVDLDATGRPVENDPGALSEQRETTTPAPTDMDALTDEQVIDEGALRDVVAAIVHEELQGDLGERITRNIRKMVRREIYRALTAKSLD
ncbi:MAG: hypothetical protein AAGI36_14130 [Pseudomonadota bacterium]